MGDILIVGGAGFIGSNLAARLVDAGESVQIFDRPNAACSLPAEVRRQLEWVEGDFTDSSALKAAMSGAKIVFHLVSTTIAKTASDDPIFDARTNLIGSIGLLEAAVASGVQRVVFSSSGGTVYGAPRALPINEEHPTDPISAYGVTKLAIEKYLGMFRKLHGLDFVALRIANPFGRYQRAQSAQGAVGVFIDKALRGETIEIWGDGEVVRDYVHISDVTVAMQRAISYAGSERVFNLGSGVGYSLNQLIRFIEQSLGTKIDVKYSAPRAVDAPANVLDISRIRREFDWSPDVSFELGIRETINDAIAARSDGV